MSDYGFRENMASVLAATVHRAQKNLVTCRHTYLLFQFSHCYLWSLSHNCFSSWEESNYDINNVCAPTMIASLPIILGLFCLVLFEARSLYVALANLELDM